MKTESKFPDHPLVKAVLSSRRTAENTKHAYVAAIDRFLDYTHKKQLPLTWETLDRWLREMLASGTKAQSLNLYLSGIKTASGRAQELYGTPDFARVVEKFPVTHATVRKALTPEEAAQLVATTDSGTPKDLRDRALLVLGLRTGLRREGIQRIDFEDFQNPTHVQVTLKGGRKHILELDEETIEALDGWIGYLLEQKIKTGPLFRSFERRTIQDRDQHTERVSKNRLTLAGIYWIIVERGKQAGLSDVHPHILRHTFVSVARDLGIPDWEIAKTTGHALGKSAPILDTYTTPFRGAVGNRLPSFTKNQ